MATFSNNLGTQPIGDGMDYSNLSPSMGYATTSTTTTAGTDGTVWISPNPHIGAGTTVTWDFGTSAAPLLRATDEPENVTFDISKYQDPRVIKIAGIVDRWFRHGFSAKKLDKKAAKELLLKIYAGYGEKPKVHFAKDIKDYLAMRKEISADDNMSFTNWNRKEGDKVLHSPFKEVMDWKANMSKYPKIIADSDVIPPKAVMKEIGSMLRDGQRAMESFRRMVYEPIVNGASFDLWPEQKPSRNPTGIGIGELQRINSSWVTMESQMLNARPSRAEAIVDEIRFMEVMGLEVPAELAMMKLPEPQQAVVDLFKLGVLAVSAEREAVIICPVPEKLSLMNGRIHNGQTGAVQWDSGYEQFFLTGVYFDEGSFRHVTKPDTDYHFILKIADVDQRMAAMRFCGADKLLKSVKSKLLHKSKRGNELHLVPGSAGVFRRDAYFLQYTDPSTGHIYVSGVPETASSRETNPYWNGKDVARSKDADLCMAWKFSMTPDEYAELSIEG